MVKNIDKVLSQKKKKNFIIINQVQVLYFVR